MVDSDRWRGVPEQEPGADAAPLWSSPLPAAGGVLSLLPSGGCLVTTATSTLAFGRDGSPRWSAALSGEIFGSTLIATSDGEFVRIEDGSIVTRALDTGRISGSFPAPQASFLRLAPWGDLLYSRRQSGDTPSVYCVGRTGSPRWSVAIDDMPPPVDAPLALGDVVVIARRGRLWAYDQTGQSVWVADQDGVREPRPADEQRRPADPFDPEHGTELFAVPARLDSGRAVVALRSYDSIGLYLLDGVAARLTPLGGAIRPYQPFTVLPHPPTEFRIAQFAGQITVGDMDWRYLVVSYDPDGRRLWEHRLPAEPIQLDAAPGGNLIATATASATRWRDYEPYYSVTLVRETFLRCISPDGTARWTWHAHGPITHLPVVASDGTVYVGAEQRLWAFAAAG